MIGPQRPHRVRDRPRFKRAVRGVRHGRQLQGRFASLARSGLPGAVRVARQVHGNGQQLGPGRSGDDSIGMQPGAEQRLLDDVLRPLPVAAGQVQRIPEQRPRVLMIKSTNEVVVADRLGMLLAPGAIANHHTTVNGRRTRPVQRGTRFTLSPATVTSSPVSVTWGAAMPSSGGRPGSATTNPTRLGTPSTRGTTEIRWPSAVTASVPATGMSGAQPKTAMSAPRLRSWRPRGSRSAITESGIVIIAVTWSATRPRRARSLPTRARTRDNPALRPQHSIPPAAHAPAP